MPTLSTCYVLSCYCVRSCARHTLLESESGSCSIITIVTGYSFAFVQSVPHLPVDRQVRRAGPPVPQQLEDLKGDVMNNLEKLETVVMQTPGNTKPTTGVHVLVAQARSTLYSFSILCQQSCVAPAPASTTSTSGEFHSSGDGSDDSYMQRPLQPQPRGFYPTASSRRGGAGSRQGALSFATGQKAGEIERFLLGQPSDGTQVCNRTLSGRHTESQHQPPGAGQPGSLSQIQDPHAALYEYGGGGGVVHVNSDTRFGNKKCCFSIMCVSEV